jgi:hypothetical protein
VSDDSLDFHGVSCYLPIAYLFLLIWFFSLLILVRFARGLSILFSFSKNQLFVLLILCIDFLFVSISFFFFYFSCLFWYLLVLVFLGV